MRIVHIRAGGIIVNDDPKIIKLGCLYIFTTPFVPDAVADIRPPTRLFSGNVEIFGDDEYFVVGLRSHWWFDETLRLSELRVALEHVWNALVCRGVATGAIPDPIDGNPLDMLPT